MGAPTQPAEAEENNEITVSEFITLGEFAEQLGVKPNEVIAVCLQLGVMTTINQRLDMDTMQTVADEFGYTVVAVTGDDELEVEESSEEEEIEGLDQRSHGERAYSSD